MIQQNTAVYNETRNDVYKTLFSQHMFACKDGQIYKVLKFQNNCN